MDGNRFDELTRLVARRSSRRGVLRGLIGAGAAVLPIGIALRGTGSSAEEGLATPEVPTAEPVVPTETPTAIPTGTSEPTVEPTATSTSIPAPTATPTAVPTRAERGTPTPAARPTTKGQAPVLAATRTLTLSVTEGPVRTSVRADARGFAANESIQLRWYTGASFRVLANITASAGGRAVKTFTVPNTPRGTHRVRAQGTGGLADASFFVRQSTSIFPRSGYSRSETLVSMRGFNANVPIEVRFYPAEGRTGIYAVLASMVTSSTGSATFCATIPVNAIPGRNRIEGAEVNSTIYAGTFFTANCKAQAGSCALESDCCSRLCDHRKGTCCGVTPDNKPCQSTDECCGGLCIGQVCVECWEPGRSCLPADHRCCGACGSERTCCATDGQACFRDSDCCNRDCVSTGLGQRGFCSGGVIG